MLNVRNILHNIVSPQNITMDLNNGMHGGAHHSSLYTKSSTIHTSSINTQHNTKNFFACIIDLDMKKLSILTYI